ncbi:4-hydroxyphenylacetate 3-monooxygenase, oxygenase component [Bacillus sp. AFS076308]|uniref:4-hydroxyphenylacetate 3-monooxygenase, oxygenase component n=1 Tax=unclassified Bacillus (in: firmicutes) TaxID=185979 RepID=UPI000BF36911|nr:MULTISPECIES: 4-hydroxyphenylacetate 3-monooxygenase, oxygenase component [unclassified Bacillus (in: firmicutes)]PFO06566.1 4-hydroxyphenylacetate 3-monooxygenase, oxygenase component [Bacillus sp. AFS076308]PGV52881.1 4-hydroxyphenylacetate 3-monooxygenase, oxygenase component [Bacillus sp. AFS037270]
MGIINGRDLIERLNKMKNEIWFDGEKIKGEISEHPAFKGILKSKAALYDLQNSQDIKNEMTFLLPENQNTIGLSYLQPKTKEDLKRRRKMIEHWARHTHGMMGRSPDYMNTVVMSFASSANVLRDRENCFPENIQSLYEMAMEHDLSFTHTFITPQVNRSQVYLGFSNEPISAKVIDQNEKGLVIKGARLLATQGGLTDEVLVFSAPRLFFDPSEAFAFSIPSNTKGLKFFCRESFVGGESSFNYPLSSKYEEMDSIVVFDNVLVPWDRVFYYDNVDAATDFLVESSFYQFAYHQVITRQIVKTEFFLGVAQLLVETINVGEYQHIHEKLSEIIIGLETLKALLEKSENDAELDEWGSMRPSMIPLQVASNIFPKIYPRFSEIIQIIGASGMISLPTESAFDSEIRAELDQYLQADGINAEDRVKLFRLAWDLTMSSFGTRQTQYERYFFGDPIRLSSNLYKNYIKDKHVEKISGLLNLKN